jgi:hypothetical protein
MTASATDSGQQSNSNQRFNNTGDGDALLAGCRV